MAPPRPKKAPAAAESWVVKPATARALKEWTEATTAEPNLMTAERDRLRARPMDRSRNPRRTGPLAGPLATRRVGTKTLPQWQHELTAAGRIWYCPDKDERIVWVTKVSLSHPKETD